jgi:hypothetical protein
MLQESESWCSSGLSLSMRIGCTCLFAAIGVAGCRSGQDRDFSALGAVTTITVVEKDRAHSSEKITDAKSISQLVAFVDAHRTGWTKPWYGIPVLVVTAEFYDGSTFEGYFGVGRNFFETQGDGGFFSKDAQPADVRRFLDLTGVANAAQGMKP